MFAFALARQVRSAAAQLPNPRTNLLGRTRVMAHLLHL